MRVVARPATIPEGQPRGSGAASEASPGQLPRRSGRARSASRPEKKERFMRNLILCTLLLALASCGSKPKHAARKGADDPWAAGASKDGETSALAGGGLGGG